MNKDEIERILEEEVHFHPSCIDMGWKWEVKEAFVAPEYIPTHADDFESFGWFIRTTFQRPDTNSGEIGKGFGRWWHVAKDVSYSGLVKTAYKACALILEHELMEAFHVQGRRIFDPHHAVEDLFSAALNKSMREASNG